MHFLQPKYAFLPSVELFLRFSTAPKLLSTATKRNSRSRRSNNRVLLSPPLRIIVHMKALPLGHPTNARICYAEVSTLEVRKPIANSSSTTSGVARCCPTATSERGRGWVGYLPLSLNARSEASEHAQMLTFSVARSPRRVIPRQDPLHEHSHFGGNNRISKYNVCS